MAYGLKYELKCLSRENKLYTVKLYFDGYSGSPVNRDVPLSPFILNKDNANVIKGTSFQFSIREEVDFEFLEFYTNNPKYIKVELYEGSTLIWIGFVAPQQYQVPYKPSPCNVTFTATDGLGLLKNEEFTLTGEQSQLSIIRHCIDKIVLNLGYSIAINLFEQNHNENYSPLTQTYEDAGLYEGMNCYDVLEKVLKKYNAEISQYGARWRIVCDNDKEEAPLLYNSQGNYEGIGSAPEILNLGYPGAGDVFPVGNLQLSLVPGGKKVKIVHDFGRKNSFFKNYQFEKYNSGVFDFWTKNGTFNVLQREHEGRKYAFLEGWTNNINMTDYIEQSVGPVSASYDDHVFEIDFSPIGIKQGISYRASIYMTVRLLIYLHAGGTTYYFLTKNGWSTTASYIEEKVLSALATPEWNKLKIITENIPASGTLYIRLCRYYASSCPSDETYYGIAFSNVYFYALHESQLLPGKVIANASFDNSTEPNDLGEIDIFCADAPDYDNSVHQFVYITRRADGSVTEGWHRKGSNTNYPLIIQLARMLASNNRVARQKLTGTIKGNGIKFNSIIKHDYNNSRKFEITEASWDLYEEKWNVKLTELLSWSNEIITFSQDFSQLSNKVVKETQSSTPTYYQGNLYGFTWPDNEGVTYYTGDKSWGDSLALSASGKRWDVLPYVASDGVMEVGKYIDFHESDEDTSDASVRLYSDSGFIFTKGAFIETLARFINDGACELYYDNSKKIETESMGAIIYGRITAIANNTNVVASFAQTNSNGYGIYIRPGNDANYALMINSADDNNNRHLFYGSGDAYFSLGTGNVGIGTTSPAYKLDVNGTMGINNYITHKSFVSGFQGDKWRITAEGDAEFESLFVRGALTVYELLINQLHYQNGGLIIGAGAGKIKSIYSSTQGSEQLYFETPEGTTMSPFSVGAIVMVQRVDINRTTVVKKLVRQVSAVQSDNRVDLTATSGWTPATDDVGVFEAGDEVCTIGHVSDSNYQNSIYMSAIDYGNPFLRVFAGVNAYGQWSLSDKSKITLQIGNLASLAGYDIVPANPGYGLYSTNVFLKGTLSSAIIETTPATYTGKDSNIKMQNADIWENYFDNDYSALHINRIGYQGGTTRYREFRVYDGKGNDVFGARYNSGSGVDFVVEATAYFNENPVWVDELHVLDYLYLNGTLTNADGSKPADLSYTIRKAASSTARNYHDAEVYTSSYLYVKVKTIRLDAGLLGQLRVIFELRTDDSTEQDYARAKIYVNGSPISSYVHETQYYTYTGKYEVITRDFAPGDTIELWLAFISGSGSGTNAYARNFRLCYSDNPTVTVPTTNDP